MQDIILARVWTDHHQRVYGDSNELLGARTAPASRMGGATLPVAGKAMVLALAASMASLGSSLATVASA